jgi:hypothetical protein
LASEIVPLRERTQRHLALVGLAHAAEFPVIGFWPFPVDALVDDLLELVLVYLHSVRIADVVDSRFVERGANVLLFGLMVALVRA